MTHGSDGSVLDVGDPFDVGYAIYTLRRG